MIRLFAVLVVVLTAYGADARFNGRWDINPATGTRGWSLEITGAETDKPAGRFVSAFNGDMNVIEKITIRDGQLEFGWPERYLTYKATLNGDKLDGVLPEKWTSVRAPAIPQRDDGSWRPGKPVQLFNGKDLAGWKEATGGVPSGWSVTQGVLAGTGKASNIISDQKFWNFALHLEFKVAKQSNSGVGLRGRYEVQVLDDYGAQPNAHGDGALYARIVPTENASKPADEWQTYDIRLVGRQVTVVLNGKKIIDRKQVEGLTAIAIDANEAQPGPIYLQGDHGPVEFRNIVVTPLIHRR